VVRHLAHPLLDALTAKVAVGSLEDRPRQLELTVPALIGDQQVPAAEVDLESAKAIGQRQLAPDDVHRDVPVAGRERDAAAHDRAPTIGSDDQIGSQFLLTRRGPHPNPRDAVSVAKQILDRSSAFEAEVLRLCGFADEHFEEPRLGEGDGRVAFEEIRVEPGCEDTASIQEGLEFHG